MRLVMLGTGHAMVTRCYNTCFALDGGEEIFLVDAGGGSGILTQAERAGLDWRRVRGIFITHAHTDHILGAIWVLRQINSLMKHGRYAGRFRVYGQAENLEYLRSSCDFLLSDPLNEAIRFVPLREGDTFTEGQTDFAVFDTRCAAKKQLGFRAVIRQGRERCVLACLGDEPCHPETEPYIRGADWLLLEAFCLKSEADVFHPYEKKHATAFDAGRTAAQAGVKNLLIYHTEDSDLENRARRYAGEAGQTFRGNIVVPRDLDVVALL